jgi:exonuclease VII small subunit
MMRRPSSLLLPVAALTLIGLSGCGGGDGAIATCGGDRSLGAPVASASAEGCLIIDGDLLIQATTATDLSALDGLQRITGHLLILDNHRLQSLDGLGALDHIGGDLVVRGNPQLPASDVEVLVDRLEASGGLGGTPIVAFNTEAEEDEELLDGQPVDDGNEEEPVDEEPADDEDPEAPVDEPVDEEPVDEEPVDEDAEDPVDEEPVDEEPVDEEPVDDFEPEDPGLDDDVDCDGDADCALDLVVERLETVLLLLEETVDATRLAVETATAGEDASAAIDTARALGELTGEAIGDLFGALFQAFLSGVDVELLWLALEDALDAADGLADALDELEVALDNAFGVFSAGDACEDAADDLEDAEQTLQVLQDA